MTGLSPFAIRAWISFDNLNDGWSSAYAGFKPNGRSIGQRSPSTILVVLIFMIWGNKVRLVGEGELIAAAMLGPLVESHCTDNNEANNRGLPERGDSEQNQSVSQYAN